MGSQVQILQLRVEMTLATGERSVVELNGYGIGSDAAIRFQAILDEVIAQVAEREAIESRLALPA